MICYIYRSPQKSEMYLYTLAKDDFSSIPSTLMKSFGTPELSMLLNLQKRNKLARVDIKIVRQGLLEQGYFLQLPPTIPDDLNTLTAAESN